MYASMEVDFFFIWNADIRKRQKPLRIEKGEKKKSLSEWKGMLFCKKNIAAEKDRAILSRDEEN